MIEVKLISVVIPTYSKKGVRLTKRCLESLRASHPHITPEVIVVSDGEEGANELEELIPSLGFRLIVKERTGFASSCNAGLQESNGLNTFLVNNDIEFFEPTLQILADAMRYSNSGVIGCRLLYPDRRIQHGGVCFVPNLERKSKTDIPGWFDHILRFEHPLHPEAVLMRTSLVTGALLGISQWAIGTVGLLDERFGFTCEDIDYCLRNFEAGSKSTYCGYTAAIHHEGATRGRNIDEKIRLEPEIYEKEKNALEFMFRKWIGFDWRQFMIDIPVTEEEKAAE